jgi:hypothetical protein
MDPLVILEYESDASQILSDSNLDTQKDQLSLLQAHEHTVVHNSALLGHQPYSSLTVSVEVPRWDH